MSEIILTVINAATLLIFGVMLSFSFCGIKRNRLSLITGTVLCLLCGLLQGVFYIVYSEEIIWKIYPLITHLPIILVIKYVFKKRFSTVFSSVFTAYLLCQPSRWLSVLVGFFTDNEIIIQSVYTGVLFITAFFSLKFLTVRISKLFGGGRSTAIFGTVPTIYYVFDYAVLVFPSLWKNNLVIATEFLPFFICLIFIAFCTIYYRENEKKSEAQQKEHIIRITVEQQAKELEAIRRSERELRILRHDLRLFLSSLSVCINQGEFKVANDLITSYSSLIEGTKKETFCTFDTVNYVLSDFSSRCQAQKTSFVHKIELTEIKVDETVFASILSNALDNALNAQMHLPEDKRQVQLVLKNADGKILLSVKNPYSKPPVFINGMPVATNEGHGTGVRSICYMTEKLNGNYQFFTRDNMFTTRIII